MMGLKSAASLPASKPNRITHLKLRLEDINPVLQVTDLHGDAVIREAVKGGRGSASSQEVSASHLGTGLLLLLLLTWRWPLELLLLLRLLLLLLSKWSRPTSRRRGRSPTANVP